MKLQPGMNAVVQAPEAFLACRSKEQGSLRIMTQFPRAGMSMASPSDQQVQARLSQSLAGSRILQPRNRPGCPGLGMPWSGHRSRRIRSVLFPKQRQHAAVSSFLLLNDPNPRAAAVLELLALHL